MADPANATLTLRDNEFGAIVARSGQVTEGGQATFEVRLLEQPSQAVTVAVTSLDTSEGTVDPSSLTFTTNSWSTRQTVTVTGVDDTVYDGDVTWTMRLDPSSGDPSYNTLAAVDVPVTTTDNDPVPTATLVLTPPSISENGGVSTVTAVLSHPSSVPSTVTVTTDSGTSVGPWGELALRLENDLGRRLRDEYVNITIAAGATTTADTVRVWANDDAVHQGAAGRTATVTGQSAGTVTGATLTLTDDEALPTAALVLRPASIVENGGVATVTATLSGPSSEAVTLTVSAAAVASTGAVAGDFTQTRTRLTIAAGSTTSAWSVTVTAVDNAAGSGSKQVTVTATAAGGNGVAAPSAVTLAIIDDELGLDVGAVSGQATEAGGQATFTVALTTQPSEAVTVSVTSLDTSEGTVAPSSLTFTTGNWSTAQTVTVTGVQDNVDDRTVIWNVRLDPSSGDTDYNTLAAVDVTTTTTTDGDPATLVLTPASIVENGGIATVTATLSGPSSEAVTLTVAAAPGTGAVAADFTLSTAKTLTLAAGATTSTGTVTVTAVDNNMVSGSKQVTVSATVAGDRGVAAPPDATLTLLDDEAATADVNGDGAVNANDGLLMYYAYTFETVFRLENDLGRRVRGFLRTLRGAGSPAADDAGYKAMLNAAWGWRSANPRAGDVNGDGSINANDGLLMYYAYTFEAVFKLETDLGRRVRGFLRTLRGAGSPTADDAGYKAMLDNAWGLR